MATPTLTSRPEKTINGFLSRWNASELPILYDIANTKWPTNTDDLAVPATSWTDNAGFLQVTFFNPTSLVAKQSVFVECLGCVYEGVTTVRSVDAANQITLDIPYNGMIGLTVQPYYSNYATRVKVYAGINGTHPLTAQKPYELIGTFDQIPDSSNQTKVDIHEYVKSKIDLIYQSSGNDISAWCDFYIEYAEVYDVVNSGVVEQFVSAFASDAGEWCHATYSALQFRNARGGNMYDYTLGILKNDVANFMTDFQIPEVINYNEFSLSLILENSSELYGELFSVIAEGYDINGNLIGTQTFEQLDDGYGLYRIPLTYSNIDRTNLEYLIVYIQYDGIDLTERKRIDINLKCYEAINPNQGLFNASEELKFSDSSDTDYITSEVFDNDILFVAWEGDDGDGFYQTFRYDKFSKYAIPLTSAFEFDTTAAAFNKVIKIDGTHALLLWRRTGLIGRILEFDSDGNVTPLGSDTTIDADSSFDISAGMVDASTAIIFWFVTGTGGLTRMVDLDTSTGAITPLGSEVNFEANGGVLNSGFVINETRSLNVWKNTTDNMTYAQIFETNAGTGAISGLLSPESIGATATTGFTNHRNSSKQIDDNYFINFGILSSVLVSMNIVSGALNSLTPDNGSAFGSWSSAEILNSTKAVNTFGIADGNDDQYGTGKLVEFDTSTGTIGSLGEELPSIDTVESHNDTVYLGDNIIIHLYNGSGGNGFIRFIEAR